MRLRSLLPSLLLPSLLALAAAPASAVEPSAWSAPACRAVSGAPSVTATPDQGATLAPTAGKMAGISYTYGLVPLDTPDTLLATVNAQVIRSTDAGCTWQPLADLSRATRGALLTLTPAAGGGAYAWAVNDTHLSPIRGDRVVTRSLPGGASMGVGVDARDGRHVRYGDDSGTIWDSRDAGATWTRLGGLAGAGVYRVSFDPHDLDHVVLGAVVSGAWSSRDGGLTWRQAAGLSSSGSGAVNVFNIVVSPAAGAVVWAMGLDIAELDAGAPSGGRHLYASTDGGATYRPVVDQDSRVTLVNGPTMVAHPTDAGVLYFIFGTAFNDYGTDLYRYDAATRQVTLTHNGYDEIGAIAFHPADARLMYLGLISEQGG